MTSDRYARQRLIAWWNQDKLRNAVVTVCGVGALGNEVLKNLALLGVGHIRMIDFDTVELSNLSRSVLFREADIGRRKVIAARDVLADLNPDIQFDVIDGDLFYDVGLAVYRHSDLIIGCLDSLAARSQVGLMASLAGVPYLDGGMWSLGGEVRLFMSGEMGTCFDCTLSEHDFSRVDERRSCSGFRNPEWDSLQRIPTVTTTSSIIAGILSQEAAKFLCDFETRPNKAIVYNGQAMRMHISTLEQNPKCQSNHEPYADVVTLDETADTLTARQLLMIAQDHYRQRHPDAESMPEPRLLLGKDFVLRFDCRNCGRLQDVNLPFGQVLESQVPCPYCGYITRDTETISYLDDHNPYVSRLLADVGVSFAAVLSVAFDTELLFFELAGDVLWRRGT